MERKNDIDQEEIKIPLSKEDYSKLNQKLRKGEICLTDLDVRIQRAYVNELRKKIVKQYPVNE